MRAYDLRRPARRGVVTALPVLIALLLLAVLLSVAAPAFAAESTLVCTQDTFITDGAPDTNFDGFSYTGLGTADSFLYRTLLKFDLSGIPGTVTSAKLRVYYYDGLGVPSGQVEVYRLKRAWTEAQTTWNEAVPGTAWSTPGGLGADDAAAAPLAVVAAPPGFPTWLEVQLDSAEIERLRNGTYPNAGFLLRADWEGDPSSLTHLYRGRTDVSAPELIITYDESSVVSTPASSTWSLAFAGVVGIVCVAAFSGARKPAIARR